jgi:hypothetical protein
VPTSVRSTRFGMPKCGRPAMSAPRSGDAIGQYRKSALFERVLQFDLQIAKLVR